MKTVLLGLCTVAMLLMVPTAEADTNIEFNNLSNFRRDGFTFPNEQGVMDVQYQAFRTSVSGGVFRQTAGRRTGENAFGGWSTSNGRIVTTGSFINGRARYADNASRRFVWGGFWTLYDETARFEANYRYLEHDILETHPNGSFFNRYINKDFRTNLVFVENGLRQINGVRFWRNNWRNYQVTIRRSSAAFRSGSTRRTVNTAARAFNENILITNRPWGNSITSVPERSRVADLQVDYIRVDNP